MKLLFTKTFTGGRTRRPGDLRPRPVDVEVFESGGQRWIRGLRLASLLGVSTSAVRQALKADPELQDDRHNRLVNLEGDSSGPVRMLTIEAARRVAGQSRAWRRFALKAFLDEIAKQ
ncbi:MAG TPA: hypothetical protein VHY79_03365 [Rhizomicrobium sp.]|jgi:hypothetical protein|nr:hypothetical protein [Rhizomicrobium sp.]